VPDSPVDLRPPYSFRRESLDPGDLPGEVAEQRKRLGGVAIVGGLVGVHLDREAEARVMLPRDPLAKALHYLRSGKSTCALTARGYVLFAGGVHPVLDVPYLPRDGNAVGDVERIGRDGGAWRTPEPGRLPREADIIMMGKGLPNGRPDPAWVRGTTATEHILLATSLAGELLESVDGGQPGVERRKRRVVRAGPGGRELWLSHTDRGLGPDGRPIVGRRVVGWIDFATMPLPREAYLPEGTSLD
jgi:hypothetical protein